MNVESVMVTREVHMSDLIRAHEGNAETNPDYPNKIHWGKFNMIGKLFIAPPFVKCSAEVHKSITSRKTLISKSSCNKVL